ncbi:MAG: PmoA family protein [Deltaproteobacteria bacterium]|nr:PmoA family protein [Deltaproteobacteria bacterium]
MQNLNRSDKVFIPQIRFISSAHIFLVLVIITILSLSCVDQKSKKFDSDGPTKLRIEQDETAETISVFRADGKEAIVTQNAKSDFRPYLHPIVTPDGKGLLTEYSPGHHKHQTGLYWGFTRVNGQAVSEDTLKKWFYRQDKPEEIASAIGRDYFHHPDGDYWQKVSASVLQATGEDVIWQTVYNMLDERGNTILTETQRWSMREQDGKFLLNLEWNGNAKIDVTIGEFDYGGMFLRMPWRKGIKGQVVNAKRQINDQADGQKSTWVDVGMQVEGREDLAHVAIFDHPSNGGYPQTWRVDGQLGIGPARARLGDWKIDIGKTETIRHQIVAYTGDLNNIELTKLWQEYTGSRSTAAL